MAYLWGFRDAVHGAVLEQRNMDILANNLANVNTPGFKGDRLIFNDIMTQQVQTDFQQGSLKLTNNVLDVAIQGDGFFQVRAKGGVRLTRDGAFVMRPDGKLVNGAGLQVLGAGGAPITLNPNGEQVYIDYKGGIHQGPELVGRLSVVDVKDKSTLEKAGSNLYAGVNGKPLRTVPARDYSISQGSLEMANVKVVNQMVSMISAHRAFESYQKAVLVMQDIDSKAATQVGRVA